MVLRSPKSNKEVEGELWQHDDMVTVELCATTTRLRQALRRTRRRRSRAAPREREIIVVSNQPKPPHYI